MAEHLPTSLEFNLIQPLGLVLKAQHGGHLRKRASRLILQQQARPPATTMDDDPYRPLRYPPEGRSFDSWQQAWEYYRDFAQKYGYGIRKGRTRHNKSKEVKHISIQCDRRETPNPTNTIRHTASRGTACPFKFNLKKGVWGWEIQYRSDHTTRAHNHTASSSALAHPVHRRAYLDEPRQEEVRSLRQLTIEAGPLVTHLVRRDGEAANITQRDLWNLALSDRFEQRQGMTLIQAFYAKMRESPKWTAF